MRCEVVLIFSLALSLAYGFTPSIRGLLETIRRDCQEQTKISNEDLENIRKVILSDGNESQKCYLKCFFKSLNFMDKIGKMTPNNGLLSLPLEAVWMLKPSIEVCNSVDVVHPCDKAMRIYRCVHTRFPSITRLI